MVPPVQDVAYAIVSSIGRMAASFLDLPATYTSSRCAVHLQPQQLARRNRICAFSPLLALMCLSGAELALSRT